jgi:glutamate carboxypeptidase
MTSAGPLTASAADALLTAARARTGELLDRVRAYVEHETPSGDTDALNAFADRLVARYTALGATAARVPAPTGDHVTADLPGHPDRAGEAPLLLIGHHDTVWPRGRLADGMPWRVDSGPGGPATAHGPGAYDMKSGLVVLEAALELAAGAGLALPPVRVVVTADEEVGSPTSTALVRERAAGARAALGFESPHPGGALKRGRRGSTRLRLHVEGRAAHAALDPEKGVSAVDELVDQLVAVRAAVARHGAAVLCNVGTVRGGGRTNVVPDGASADIGLRFADADVERAVLDALTDPAPVRPGARVRTEILSRRPTWAPDGDDDTLTAAVRAAGRLLGAEVGTAPAAGAADTNTVGALGLPVLDGFGPTGAGAHAAHERIDVAALPERAALVAAVLATA